MNCTPSVTVTAVRRIYPNSYWPPPTRFASIGEVEEWYNKAFRGDQERAFQFASDQDACQCIWDNLSDGDHRPRVVEWYENSLFQATKTTMTKIDTFYTHDCVRCTWLASIQLGPNRESYDLYFCPIQTPATVIARFGHDPPDYTSGMALAEQLHLTSEGTAIDALRIAWLIARDLAYGQNAGSPRREDA